MDVALWGDALQPQLTGIGRYTLELVRGLPADPRIGSVAIWEKHRRFDSPDALLTGAELPRHPRLLRRFLRWRDPRSLRNHLFHGPNYFLPDFVERGIVTVHDLSVFRFPETHPAERIKHFARDLPSSLERAAHVITDTETVRQEVIAEFGMPAHRVTAVPLGVSAAFRPHSTAELHEPLGRFGLHPGSYGLSVSTLEPRKKSGELIAAWRCLPAALRTRFPLVLVGAKGWSDGELIAAIEQGERKGWLLPLGYVPEAMLPILYAGAGLFIYPSIYEGFGLPPLEAMASGVPVVVADRSCMPEVCGDAAFLVDPDDVDGFAQVLARALTDEGARCTNVTKGLERARTYDWKRCISETIDVYASVDR
jgi:alpha-1,3-rhamnosyl/mannosyltransferase